jgi:hypothetical protein
MLAMKQAAVQEKRNADKGPSTPKTKPVKIVVVGETSGSTWGQRELDKFHVNVEAGISARELIPDDYWDFTKFKGYDKCTRIVCIPN